MGDTGPWYYLFNGRILRVQRKFDPLGIERDFQSVLFGSVATRWVWTVALTTTPPLRPLLLRFADLTLEEQLAVLEANLNE